MILGTGTPNLAIHQDGVGINQPYDESQGGAFQVGGDTYVDGYLTTGSCKNISNTNLNNLALAGTFRGENLTNAPTVGTTKWWYVHSFIHDSNYRCQVLYYYFDTDTTIYKRKNGGRYLEKLGETL